MKKVAVFYVLILLLFGCGTGTNVGGTDEQTGDVHQKEPGITGYIVSMEGERILVVSSEPKDFSETGGLKEFYEAIFVSNVQEEVNIGQKVSVWFDGPILESFPAQGEAEKISILPSLKPDGADLTDSDVIKIALETTVELEGVPAIKEVTYNPESDVWDVVLVDTIFENKEYHVQVEDRPLHE